MRESGTRRPNPITSLPMAQGKTGSERDGRKARTSSSKVTAGGNAAPAPDDDDGLFVDDVARPQDDSKRKSKRAAERRREQGRAPDPVFGSQTNTSLKDKQHKPAAISDASTASSTAGVGYGRGVLTCVKGPEEGLALNLIEGTYTIGRARENSFVLKDIACSRKHLEVRVDASRVRVVDLGSGNGSRVNGKRVAELDLKNGDRIEIGGSVLVFTAMTAPDGGGRPGFDQAAQERLVRAAEALAAELSDKRGAAEDSHFDDSQHQAKTQHLPQVTADQMRAEAERLGYRPQQPALVEERSSSQLRTKAPDRLWSETHTNVPLNEVVPADEPLRGGRPTPDSVAGIPDPRRGERVREVRREDVPQRPQRTQPVPRARAVVHEPPPPPQSSLLSGFILSLLVVVLVGGAVLVGSWWFYFRPQAMQAQAAVAAQPAAAVPERTVVDTRYAEALAGLEEKIRAKDWLLAKGYADAALELRPDDPIAKKLAALVDQNLPPPAPPPQQATSTATPTSPPGATSTATPAPTPPPQAAPPQVAPPPPPPAQVAEPAPPPPAAKPAPQQQAAKPKPKPKPAAKPAPRALDDDEAGELFKKAVGLVKDDDVKGACRLFERIADRADPESTWRTKAKRELDKRCE